MSDFQSKLLKNSAMTNLGNEVIDVIYFIILMRNCFLKKAGLSDHPNNELQVLFLSPLSYYRQPRKTRLKYLWHFTWNGKTLFTKCTCRKNAVPPLLHSYLIRAGTVSGFEISGQSMKCLFKPQMSIQFVHFSFSYCQFLTP